MQRQPGDYGLNIGSTTSTTSTIGHGGITSTAGQQQPQGNIFSTVGQQQQGNVFYPTHGHIPHHGPVYAPPTQTVTYSRSPHVLFYHQPPSHHHYHDVDEVPCCTLI